MEMKKIFDVFSKKPSEAAKRQAQRILADYREKNSLVISEMVSMGLDVEFRDLKVADYIVGKVAVERKTVGDFISSMKSKRMARQIEEMQQYEDKLLIIEGIDEQELYSESSENGGMHPNAVRGFLLSILLRHKVPIVFAKDYEDTARFIGVLAKKKGREAPLNVSKKNLGKKERMQFIVEAFPGIGPKTARRLLKKFGSIKKIVNSSEDIIRGEIGKKAESFRIVDEEY
jgi:Fanconi anemia group M protein